MCHTNNFNFKLGQRKMESYFSKFLSNVVKNIGWVVQLKINNTQ